MASRCGQIARRNRNKSFFRCRIGTIDVWRDPRAVVGASDAGADEVRLDAEGVVRDARGESGHAVAVLDTGLNARPPLGLQAPARAVRFRRHAVGSHQVPLQHLQLFAVLEAHDIVRLHRGTDRNLRLRLGRRFLLALAEAGERPVKVIDKQR